MYGMRTNLSFLPVLEAPEKFVQLSRQCTPIRNWGFPRLVLYISISALLLSMLMSLGDFPFFSGWRELKVPLVR